MSRIWFFLVLVFLSRAVAAQETDSLTRHKFGKVIIAPVILIGSGLYATTDNDFLANFEFREERNEHLSKFRTHADNYFQFAPIAVALGMKALGVESRNNWVKSISLLVKSEVLMGTLVYAGKKLTAVPRPDTGTQNSFPSGHTAQAFMAATYLHKEFGKGRPWLTIGGYTLASGVGLLRVMNDRHWVSDVLAGAGVGILSTNLAYLTQKKHSKVKNHNSSLSSFYLPKGLGFRYTLSL